MVNIKNSKAIRINSRDELSRFRKTSFLSLFILLVKLKAWSLSPSCLATQASMSVASSKSIIAHLELSFCSRIQSGHLNDLSI